VHCVDDALRDLVTEGAPLTVLKAHATQQGVQSLALQAARHVLARRTTTEEIKRVVGWL
jgi:type II secretory ATPase GspE/PulE/Tfp pilus assembly ATPase PilB-like protein